MNNQDEQTDYDIESVHSEIDQMLDDVVIYENNDDLTHSCFILTLFLCSFGSFMYGSITCY